MARSIMGRLAACLMAIQVVYAAEMRMAFSPSMYESGEVMNQIMERKHADWADLKASGLMNHSLYPSVDAKVPCVDGKAVAIAGDDKNTFRCHNIDLYDFKTHKTLGSKLGFGSSSWGWTSPEGREFIAIGQQDGTAFAEITKEGRLEYLGRMPQYSVPSLWREIRGFKNFMIIGSEAERHGIQIFDMTKLLDLNPATPKNFTQKDLTGHFKGLPIGRTHNVVVNEESNHIFSVGAEPRTGTCRAGIIMVNVTDPSNPTQSGCAPEGGYVHDAQCLIYRGPHTKYVGREICYGYNEKNFIIYDITDKQKPTIISKTTYDGVAYCHQGWVLDKMNQEYLLMDDEYDEVRNSSQFAPATKPTTYIWSIKDLEKPVMTGHFKGTVDSVDHNQYIYNGLSYQSNYASGLRVMDVRSIPSDPTGKGVKEVGFFDIYPEDDKEPAGGKVSFVGSWSSFAGFPSRFIFVNSMERGGFIVKLQKEP